ncbi:protein of unknown function [Sphingobacterium nematocida]|uniref:DUF4304 domain-containing protein n=1 Tax=Sphingobacterium nematocida TaxID=1513896 RepID=A0A1T5GJ12_9SPHI|nr:DUF4304 domain-containing protein [Sphingobacterium nematocida]SKC08403.1 protein of unknown function [Sphingobacterium nematocida]
MNKMNASEFKKLSTKFLAPRLREKGWKGSGFNFYRTTDNSIVHILGIQGAWYGGSVCCETAIHFDFIPDLAGKNDPSKVSYASCMVRQRLSPKGGGDYHWTFRDNEHDNINSLNQIFEALETFGEKFYQDFNNFPSPFDKIKPNDFLTGERVVLLDKYYVYNEFSFIWLLKEINLKINRPEIAREFSEIGIEKASKYYNKLIDETKSEKQKELTREVLDNLTNQLKIE